MCLIIRTAAQVSDVVHGPHVRWYETLARFTRLKGF